MSSSLLRPWLLAARPKTLVATVAPVSVGAALAYSHGLFNVTNFVVALASALFIQVGTNLANDYHDFAKGADRTDRVGPLRVTQSGLISPSVVRFGYTLCFIVAATLGAYLVYDAGPMIMAVGAVSIVSGVAYTAGPWPLAYVGLGELFVLLFFGPVASGFTYFVLAHEFNNVAFLLGLCPGALSCAILVVNNLRDIAQDTQSKKRTLAVRFGTNFAKAEYVSFWVFAFLVLVSVAVVSEHYRWLLPLATMPRALSLSMRVYSYKNPAELIAVLEGTAKTLALFALLLCAGIIQ